ncbi:MAG: hypothetical protein P8X74_15580 [Reinekea sp.]
MDRSNWPPYHNMDCYSLYQEYGQHASQPEAGYRFQGIPASMASGSVPALEQPDLNPSTLEPIPFSPGMDWEYLLRTPQPTTLEEIIQNNTPPVSPTPQPAAPRRRLSIRERFMAGIDKYAQGVPLKDCSETIPFRNYVSDSGQLHKRGREVYAGLSSDNQDRVNQALLSRQKNCGERSVSKGTVEGRFLAGLDKYAQGVPLKECSETLQFANYVADNGSLHQMGQALYDSMSPEDQARVNRALISRSSLHCSWLADNDTIQERFLAVLDDYARGLSIAKCSKYIHLNQYVTDDGHVQTKKGQSLYNRLSKDDKTRVDQALAKRAKIFTRCAAKDVDKFMATLEPYANGLPLSKCGNQSGLKRKANDYFTPEGGLTRKGNRLIENLQPDQLTKVWDAINKRPQSMELNPQVPESPWRWPEMLSPMPEIDAVNQAPMADLMQGENMSSAIWQLTGQAMQGRFESAEPHMDFFGSDAVGADIFSTSIGPHGPIP